MGNSNNRRTRNQDIIREAKGHSCTDCGITLPACLMSFSHVGEKRFQIGPARPGSPVPFATTLPKPEELAKCVLVCPRSHLECLAGKETNQEFITILRHNFNEMYTYLRQ
jgi:Fe-S-cluster-containing hydrogenase component 2